MTTEQSEAEAEEAAAKLSLRDLLMIMARQQVRMADSLERGVNLFEEWLQTEPEPAPADPVFRSALEVIVNAMGGKLPDPDHLATVADLPTTTREQEDESAEPEDSKG